MQTFTQAISKYINYWGKDLKFLSKVMVVFNGFSNSDSIHGTDSE